jgi:hypothetical protein
MKDLIIQYVNDDCNILNAMQTNTYLINMLLNQKNGAVQPLDKSQLTAINSKGISTYSKITFAKTLFIPNSCFVDDTGCVSNFFRKFLTTLVKQIDIFFKSAMRQVNWASLRSRK